MPFLTEIGGNFRCVVRAVFAVNSISDAKACNDGWWKQPATEARGTYHPYYCAGFAQCVQTTLRAPIGVRGTFTYLAPLVLPERLLFPLPSINDAPLHIDHEMTLILQLHSGLLCCFDRSRQLVAGSLCNGLAASTSQSINYSKERLDPPLLSREFKRSSSRMMRSQNFICSGICSLTYHSLLSMSLRAGVGSAAVSRVRCMPRLVGNCPLSRADPFGSNMTLSSIPYYSIYGNHT